MSDMNAIWRQAPLPALRVWSGGASLRWELNQAAGDWGAHHGVTAQDWARLAALPAQAGTLDDRVPLRAADLFVTLSTVLLPDGALLWIQPQFASPDPMLSAVDLMALVRDHGHMGCVVRDLDTGVGRWDRRVFEIMGLPPEGGVPGFDAALQLVHPDDRADFAAAHDLRSTLPGRYSLRFRIVRPDGQLSYLRSVYEVLPPAPGRPRRLFSLLIDETESVENYRRERDASDVLSKAVSMSGISVWQIDMADGRVHFNEQGYRMLGMLPRPEGLTLPEVRATVHPADLLAITQAAEQALSGAGVVDVLARYADGHGGWRHLLTRRVAQRDETGQAVALTGVSLDLTELNRERDRSHALADRMQLAAEAIGVGFWWRDLDLGVLDWDDRMFRLHHRSPAEGTPSLEEFLARHIHPADSDLLRGRQQRHLSEWPQSSELTFRILTPEGETRWIQSWTRRLWRDGRRLSFGMHVDVTERHEAQLRMERERERDRYAIEAAAVGVWDRKAGGQPGYWSPTMYRLRGLDPADPRHLDELMTLTAGPDVLAAGQLQTDRCLAGLSDYRLEYEVVWPDGTRRWLLSAGRLQCGPQGEPLGVAGITVDITERRQSEQLARERDRAEQASAAKSELMARVSHELRTPMNAVLGFTELMALDALTDLQRERLDRIRSAGTHLLGLIDDVLALSQAEAEAKPLRLEPVALEGLLNEALHWVAPMAQAAGVELQAGEALSAAVGGASVLADRRRLGQIVTNLLTNAVKYNRPGGRVWLRVTPQTLDGQAAWQLSVCDDGRGLSAEQQARLFEPFNRLGAEREGIPGTGIGLSIVQRLACDMGAGLQVRSAPGQGSEFQVTLPAATGVAGPVLPMPQAVPEAVAAASMVAPLAVVYIEDNPVNEMLVRQMLSLRPGFRLDSAEDGQSGIALVLRLRPQVVLLDLQLPDLPGLEVLRRLRAVPALAGTRFIALSANAMPDDVAQALSQGFDAYWTKPLNVARFLADMDALAASWRGEP